MVTLSYGYKKPETNDKGPVVFPALEGNIQQLNDHTHNGSNSSLLTAQSFVAETQTLLLADWVLVGGGTYHQVKTMLAGYTYDLSSLTFRDPDGTYVYPTVIKISNTQFDVYTNDATIDMIALYGV